MRICMLVHSFYESDSRVRLYAEALSCRGDYVDVVSLRSNNSPRTDRICGVNVYRIQKRTFNENNKIVYLMKLLLFLFKSMFFVTGHHLKKRYQLIHVHSVPDFEVFATLIAKITGAKIILDIHDIVPEFYASKFNNDKKSILFKALLLVEAASCSFADHVIISNHLWAEKLASRSVKKDKVSVVMNYPDLRYFKRKSRKRIDGSIVAIYPGTFLWHQGVDIAIRAIAQLKEEVPFLELHLYGKGPEEPALRRLAEKLGIRTGSNSAGYYHLRKS